MSRFIERGAQGTVAITGVGVLLVLVMLAEGAVVVADVSPLPDGYGIGVATSMPFLLALVFGSWWLEGSGLSPDRHNRVAKWCVSSCLVFVVIVMSINLEVETATLLLVLSTLRWAGSIGAGVGFLIGVFEARAIEQAIESEQLRVRKQQTERERDRLEEFASIVSHDLRNPLNVAEGRLELARRECDSEHLDDVGRAHDRMAELIEDLLELARAGARTGAPETVALATVVEESWQNVAASDATLRVSTDRTIEADERRLRQLLENLLRNAVEHGSTSPRSKPSPEDAVELYSTRPGREESADAEKDVTITVGDLDDGFYVADDGPGIPAADRSQVFEMGYTTGADGTGLGLAIVKEVVDAHGWTIRATESANGGARFEITGVAFDR